MLLSCGRGVGGGVNNKGSDNKGMVEGWEGVELSNSDCNYKGVIYEILPGNFRVAVLNKDEKKCNLKVLVIDKIHELFNEKGTLNTEVLYIQEYSSTCKFSSKGSIRLPGFKREIKIQLGRTLPYSCKLFLRKCDNETRNYSLIFSLSDNDLVEFEIISDKNLSITKIVEMTEKHPIPKDKSEIKILILRKNEKELPRNI
ncbi:hypothetical protein CWI37_0009p0050 [Hamiltosporidium tvaerminnensis]|uniref:Uncharacterized protein n=1 Tax=Hamiltosporidium tvaerminnensis TaxID=1176355 RepID=A0A4Q9LF58_9MICR|nr:hypothetical protein CWI37_0009p0050 [Hamiltosporidium tvaerminnensis]